MFMWYKIIMGPEPRSYIKTLGKKEKAKILDLLGQLAEKRWFVGKLMDEIAGLKTIRLDNYKIIYKVEYNNLLISSIKKIN